MYLNVFFYCIIIVYKEKESLKKQNNPIPQAPKFEKDKKKVIIVGLKYSLNNYYVKKEKKKRKRLKMKCGAQCS